jgi:hypothetical protein
MTPEAFARELRNLESMYRRLDRGELTGRNSTSSDDTRRAKYERLRDAVAADALTEDAPLCAYLDGNEKLATRWSLMERRSVGLDPRSGF